MVDRAARDEYAGILSHFAAGFLTRQDYERRAAAILQATPDAGVHAVYVRVGSVYDGIRESDKLKRRSLHREAGRKAARWVRFLETDAERLWMPARRLVFRWPVAWTVSEAR